MSNIHSIRIDEKVVHKNRRYAQLVKEARVVFHFADQVQGVRYASLPTCYVPVDWLNHYVEQCKIVHDELVSAWNENYCTFKKFIEINTKMPYKQWLDSVGLDKYEVTEEIMFHYVMKHLKIV